MKTVLHYYRFSVDDPQDAKAYGELCRELTLLGLKKVDTICDDHHRWYQTHIKPLNGQAVELETKHLFSNQWNTAPTVTSENGLRIFDWAEAIYPNSSIKEGQWLEQTEEMIEARHNRYTCGYCGHQADNPKVKWCTYCLGSAYLKESELHLLRLQPVCNGLFGGKREQTPPKWLITQYRESQRDARTKRLDRDKARQLEKCRRGIENAQTEYNGFKWLIDHDINYQNCIFYDHRQIFSFGWRQPLQQMAADELEKQLTDFPWPYEIKRGVSDERI